MTKRQATTMIPALLLVAVAAPVESQPAAVHPEPRSGRVVEVEVPAPALEGNLLDTPTTQGVAVYLPPSYDLEPLRRYPVVYLLHGIFDDYRVWLGHFGVPSIVDRLIAGDDAPEMIVVMPNGGNRYGGGFYRDSPVSGNWGSYIASDLVRYVDEHFRTLSRRGGRAVVGHSMGGYGAIHLAMTRPDVFSVVWAMSPCCLAAIDDYGFGNESWKTAARAESAADIEALLEAGEFYAVATLGVATAFTPDPEAPPLFVDFPFELVRGESVLDEEDYDRYLDSLPLRRVHDSREALRSLAGLGLDAGLGDQFLHIPRGTLALSEELGDERIPHRLDVYDGDHRKLVAERLEQVILPWVGERLTTD